MGTDATMVEGEEEILWNGDKLFGCNDMCNDDRIFFGDDETGLELKDTETVNWKPGIKHDWGTNIATVSGRCYYYKSVVDIDFLEDGSLFVLG